MATSADPTSQAAALQPTLQAAAQNPLFHLYGEAGPPWGTSFADLAELALRLGHTLAAELLRQSLARQAATPPTRPTPARPAAAPSPPPRPSRVPSPSAPAR